jgi:hypothetical protein
MKTEVSIGEDACSRIFRFFANVSQSGESEKRILEILVDVRREANDVVESLHQR